MKSILNAVKKVVRIVRLAVFRKGLSLISIIQMSEEKAYNLFLDYRWQAGSIKCPSCGLEGAHYYRKKEKRWRCKGVGCGRYFSLFSGTVFQDGKLSPKTLLAFLFIFCVFSNGISTDHLSLLLNIQTKTALALMGKLREMLLRTRNLSKLSGIVHMDGGHFGGRPRHGRIRRVAPETIAIHVENMLLRKSYQPKSTQIRNSKQRAKNRRIVFVLRQVSDVKGEGGIRTIVEVGDGEDEKFALSLALKYIEPGTTVMTDENAAYSQFGKYFIHEVVCHSKEFAREDGVNSNQAESYFSRLRRHVLGVAHRIEPKYMLDIANEMAWREDVRKLTISERLDILMQGIFTTTRSIYWTGYWQNFKRPGELVWSPRDARPMIRVL